MKMANSKNIKKLLEHDLNIDEIDESVAPGPCYEAKIDRKKNTISFLIDNDEKLAYNLSKVNQSWITKEGLCYLINILRSQDLDILRKELKPRK
jgi:hypothetical protein